MKKQEEVIYDAKFWKPKINEDIVLHKAHFNNYGFDKHVHEDYTIGLIYEGQMDAFVDGQKKKLNKASVITINPDETHACQSQYCEGYKHYSLYLKPSFVKKFQEENFYNEELFFSSGIFENQYLANKLTSLIMQNEYKTHSNIDFECDLVNTLNELFLNNSKAKTPIILSKHDMMINRAKEFMNYNLHLDLSLDDISNELDISKYHFLRLFKQKTFISPHSYLMLKRIERAKQALQKGESIINTTYMCGFNDQSHLSRRFKAFVGLTPGNYRKFFN
ncbi:AraC family transcriptional regulator [Arcobacter roscoffensis]|uniref:AraC family transcriptional regulator n=1 Tax=Arcobacter roscoffensis TaxID=2961520 RepID=A0ABY5E1H4_9BACT|nr:AraC family transcriptional regulator [Arcobacter roscoffensis]UTJ05722.1 AraC family transcriptional regulator [Arcobacter roscoffensis]